ncbi:DUF3043 domain-containing protein [Corynebacterium sp. 21KM1197]|uniref:DUF3043 domain-containing protein n=1 Tax=Corynebacterium sp. 21KM1197 TaxID=2989734 RepID=UPI0029CA22D2|nr:DUF3043 domain-containing protein [Corynebacterium sp. 21KM1197]WPF67971.1 DUF3043 domain-containing protein [Corynebacterium sp. 21KM1197]
MKLPWQNSNDSASPEAPAEAPAPQQEESTPLPKGYTAPKGRPTPKRKDVELERGVIRGTSMAPTTPQQQRQKRKELKASMSKQEWKDYKRKEREESRRRQRAMDRGEERYLLPRDKGPERAFARDWVDSRRFLNNWVMPFALVLFASMFVTNGFPEAAGIVSLVSMAIILLFAVEGIILARRANRAVRAEFPETTQAGIGFGFYVYSRASQPRRWRSPKPRVELGATVGRINQ